MQLTYEQFLAKHANSAKWQSLPKSEKKARYATYLASGPNPQFSRKGTAGQTGTGAMAKSLGSPSAGKYKGKTAYDALSKSLGLQLSPATHNYLTALYNPFCPRLPPVGYPDGAPAGSVKNVGFSGFNLVTNAAGFGCVLANPVACGAGNILGISYSGLSTYTQAFDAFPVSSGAIGMSAASLAGLSFTTASGGPGLMWRLVAFGIRIRSTQALLNKQSSIKTVCLPIPDSDLWTVTGADIISLYRKNSHRYVGNTAESPWFSAIWSPTSPSNGQFVRTTNPADVPAANTIYCDISLAASYGASGLGILISGAPSAVFECECYGWYEYFGAAATLTGQQTASYSDPVGVAAVSSLVASANPADIEKNQEGSSLLSSLTSAAVTIGGQMTKQYMGGSNKPQISSTGGYTQADVDMLPSVPKAATTSVSTASSLMGYISDAAEYLPEVMALMA